MNTKLSWTTVQKRVNDLVPQEVNPRKISDKQMSDLKRSLKKFNLAEIPAIDTDGKILAGHQRIKALQLLGRGDELIDVRIPNRKLTEQEVKEYLIGSNQLGGDWDYDLLKDFDLPTLEFSGFDSIEISKFFDPDKDTKDDNFNVPLELNKIKTPRVKPGDMILMGDHKLFCTSCTDNMAVQILFEGTVADTIYMDPPYNINLSYDKGVGGTKSKKNYGGTIDDDKSPEEYKEFMRQCMKNALMVSRPDVHVAYWCDEAWVWIFQTLFIELGIKNRRVNIWLKNNASPTPNVAFNKCIETCVYGTRGTPYLSDLSKNLNEIQNKEMTTGNELFEQVSNIWNTKRLPSSEMEHPTSKSPELHHKFIMRCTKPGDVIFDGFSGSASTIIAADQLGRKVYATEIEPIFCDLAIRRYEKLTGRKAIILENYYEERKNG